MSLGPLISYYSYVDPQLLGTALGATGTLFAAFTVSSFYSSARLGLFLRGWLGAALSTLLYVSLAQFFLPGSDFLYSVQLYLGLLAFSGFVVRHNSRD